ncbi:hypothetical protein U1Q18_032484 [Sarracenia purpurea var. burkii]
MRLMFLAKQNAQRAATPEASGDTKAGEERRRGEEEDGEPNHADVTSHGHRRRPRFGTPPPGSAATSERHDCAKRASKTRSGEGQRRRGRPAPPSVSPGAADKRQGRRREERGCNDRPKTEAKPGVPNGGP